VDDCTGFRAVLVRGMAEIRENIAAEPPRFRAIRDKHGMAVPGEEEQLRADRGGPGAAGHHSRRALVQLDALGPGLTLPLRLASAVSTYLRRVTRAVDQE
jgi:hypothetical protein